MTHTRSTWLQHVNQGSTAGFTVQPRLTLSGTPLWSVVAGTSQPCLHASFQHHTAETLLTGFCGSAAGAVIHNSCAAGLQASVPVSVMELPPPHISCDQQSTTADWRQAGKMALASTLKTSTRLSDHRPYQRFHPYSTPASKQLRSTVPDHSPTLSIQRDQCCIPALTFRTSAANTKPPAAARLHPTNRQLPPWPSSQSGTAHTCKQHSITQEPTARPSTTANHHPLHATQHQSPTHTKPCTPSFYYSWSNRLSSRIPITWIQATSCNSKSKERISTIFLHTCTNSTARCPQSCASCDITQCPEAADKTQICQHASCQQTSSTHPSSPAPNCTYSSTESSDWSIHLPLSNTTTAANSCRPQITLSVLQGPEASHVPCLLRTYQPAHQHLSFIASVIC